MFSSFMVVGSSTKVQIGFVCSEKDYDTLVKFKKYFSQAMKHIAGNDIRMVDTLPSDSTSTTALELLNCDVLIIILSIDLLSDGYFIKKDTGLADALISQIDRNSGSILGIYILARSVYIPDIPQPKSEKIIILPINQQPLDKQGNEDDAYMVLCKLVALEIQNTRYQRQIQRLEDKVKRLENLLSNQT